MPGARRRDTARASAPLLPAATDLSGWHLHHLPYEHQRSKAASLDLYVLHVRPTTAPPFLRAYGVQADAPPLSEFPPPGFETQFRTSADPPVSFQRPQSRTRPAPSGALLTGIQYTDIRQAGPATSGPKCREPATGGSSGGGSPSSSSYGAGGGGCGGTRMTGHAHRPLTSADPAHRDAPPDASLRRPPSPDPLAPAPGPAQPRPRPSALGIPDLPPSDPTTPRSARASSLDLPAAPAVLPGSSSAAAPNPAATAVGILMTSPYGKVGRPRPACGVAAGPAATASSPVGRSGPSPRAAAIRYVNTLITDVLDGMKAQRRGNDSGGGSSRSSSRVGSARGPDMGYRFSSHSGGGSSTTSSNAQCKSSGYRFGRNPEPMGRWLGAQPAPGPTGPGAWAAEGGGEDGAEAESPGSAGRWMSGNRCSVWRTGSGRQWAATGPPAAATTSAAAAVTTATPGSWSAMSCSCSCSQPSRQVAPSAVTVAEPSDAASVAAVRRASGAAVLEGVLRGVAPPDAGSGGGSDKRGGDCDGRGGRRSGGFSDRPNLEKEGSTEGGAGTRREEYDDDNGSGGDDDGGGAPGPPGSSVSSSFLQSLMELHSVAAAAAAGGGRWSGGGGSVAAMVHRLVGYDSLGASKRILEARERLRSGQQQHQDATSPHPSLGGPRGMMSPK